MTAPLPLTDRIRFGAGIAAANREAAIEAINSLAAWGYDLIWMPDHVAFTGPVSDPFAQLTYFSALQPNLTYGTGVYLLPLRHPVTVAKVAASVDRLMGAGHFIFGYRSGRRISGRIRSVRNSGKRARRTHQRIDRDHEAAVERRARRASRKIFQLRIDYDAAETCHARRSSDLDRRSFRRGTATRGSARLGDGWMPHVITAERFAEGLEFIALEAELAHRNFTSFGTAAQVFATIADSL